MNFTNPARWNNIKFLETIPYANEMRHIFTLGPSTDGQTNTGTIHTMASHRPDRLVVVDRFKCASAQGDPTNPVMHFNLFRSDTFVWGFPLKIQEVMTNPIFENISFLIPPGYMGNLVFFQEYNQFAETYIQFRVRELEWKEYRP
jgi:hypothetical protein